MPRQVAPEISGGGVVDIGNADVHRDDVTHDTLEVVTALLAAIGDLPGLLGVVAGDGRSGPDVPVAGDLAAVVEVVENAELPRQLVLVGRDVFAIHHQRRIAVGLADVAEELIVGAVLLDDVDDVVNGIAAVLEDDLAGAAFHQIAAHNFFRQLLAVTLRLGRFTRAIEPRIRDGNIGVLLLARMRGIVFPTGIWACALAFAGCNRTAHRRGVQERSGTTLWE